MATDADLRRLALALEGTIETPHFDRVAYKVARIYATLAPDKRTANLRFTPDLQALKCATAPEVFSPVSGAWGAQGWTTMHLAAASNGDLLAALADAWANAQSPRKSKPARRRR